MSDPQLVVVCGAPGVGKSTVAELVAERLDAELFRTDVVRKELTTDPSYSESETNRVYAEVLERAEASLMDGEAVVLDGTFRTRTRRDRTRQLADGTGAPVDVLRVVCDRSVVAERIRNRENDASDADLTVHDTVLAQFEPLREPHTVVDNSGSLEEAEQRVEELF